jgi:hypothetical protein
MYLYLANTHILTLPLPPLLPPLLPLPEFRYRRPPEAAPREAALQHAGRGRHPGGS